MLLALRASGVQGPVYEFRASRTQALVHSRLWPCAVPDRNYPRRATMLESHHIPLWQGHDAQGLPPKHELDGSYHGQLC